MLLEWDHGRHGTLLELAWWNGVSGYAGKANWYRDRDAPSEPQQQQQGGGDNLNAAAAQQTAAAVGSPTMARQGSGTARRHETSLHKAIPPEMKSPWDNRKVNRAVRARLLLGRVLGREGEWWRRDY